MDLPVVVGQVLANKYRVDRFIGAGGMGVVAAGFHLELDQPVAIKFLGGEAGWSEEGAERFRREARAVAKIHSEHVVRVFDVGLLNERMPYMVMELLEGNDLEQELELRGALPISEAVGYVLQAIDAVAEAHAAGIVHRDLKPTNLYLALQADGLRVVKVLDFGISKLTAVGRIHDIALTRSATLVGSPYYMSPEQMRSAKDVDARTDVWALGAILYVLVTAQLPHFGASLPEICVAVLNDPHRPVRELLPDAPAALDALLARCLAKDRTQRFASVAELAQHLVPFAPDFRVHAERAARLLNRPARESLSPTTPLPSEVPSRASAAQGTPRPPGFDERPPPASGATPASWDKTGRNAMNKRRVPMIVAALVALVSVLGLVVKQLSSSEGTELETAPKASQGTPPTASTRPTVQTLAAATPAAEAQPVESEKPAQVPPEPSAAERASPTGSAAARMVAGATRSRAVVFEKRSVKGSQPSTEVTYFGGRR